MTRSITLNDKELKQIQDGILPESVQKKVQTALKPRAVRFAKNKGAGFQKECADKIADLLNVEWDNTDDRSVIKTRTMGSSGTDLIMLEPVYSSFPFDVEAKAVENLSLPKTIEQAQSNTGDGRHWLIMWKHKMFKDTTVVLSWKAFEWLWNRRK